MCKKYKRKKERSYDGTKTKCLLRQVDTFRSFVVYALFFVQFDGENCLFKKEERRRAKRINQ